MGQYSTAATVYKEALLLLRQSKVQYALHLRIFSSLYLSFFFSPSLSFFSSFFLFPSYLHSASSFPSFFLFTLQDHLWVALSLEGLLSSRLLSTVQYTSLLQLSDATDDVASRGPVDMSTNSEKESASHSSDSSAISLGI